MVRYAAFCGAGAGRRSGFDLRHTAVGAATDQSAALLRGMIFGVHLSRKQNAGFARIARVAAVLGVVVPIVDYGLMPKRFTPRWELALGKTAVGLAMAATAAGLGLGGVAARALEE